MKHILIILSITMLQICVQNVIAAPKGSDLFTACTQSMDNGFDSIQGQMCAWYVIPCNCSYEKSLPEVCAPEGLSIDELASIVTDGLKDNDHLMDESAGYSAAVILSGKFPCDKNPVIEE